MIKEFKDGNKDIVTMFKGTDRLHHFVYMDVNGSTLNWDDHDIKVEGRLAIANEKHDFLFESEIIEFNDIEYFRIKFDKTQITTDIRENKVYWKVLATHKTLGLAKILRYGEIWFKEA